MYVIPFSCNSFSLIFFLLLSILSIICKKIPYDTVLLRALKIDFCVHFVYMYICMKKYSRIFFMFSYVITLSPEKCLNYIQDLN